MQTVHLSTKDHHILERIFQHPTSHNLEWHDVIALIDHLGTVEEKENGHLTFIVNGVSEGFHRSREKDVSEVEQVLDIRRFLERAGIGKNGAMATEVIDSIPKLRLLVVTNQQETLIFRAEGKDSVPERLHPYDPRGVLHHLDHTRGGDIESRAPENLIYYQQIAAALAGAEEILLMGNGTGGSSGMKHLQDFLATHHPEIANRIVGDLTLDLEALTEGQLLQEARAFFMRREGRDTMMP